jgi:hypothetical protein
MLEQETIDSSLTVCPTHTIVRDKRNDITRHKGGHSTTSKYVYILQKEKGEDKRFWTMCRTFQVLVTYWVSWLIDDVSHAGIASDLSLDLPVESIW